MPLTLKAILFFGGLAFAGTPTPTPTTAAITKTKLSEVLERIQSTWDTTKSYQADFKQVIFTKRIGTREETAGVLSVVKPGKLRWEAKNGPLQILDGNKLINIQTKRRKKTRVVDVYADVSKQMDNKMLGFLSGKTQFKEWYRTEIISESPTQIEVKLTPRDEKIPNPNDIFLVEFDRSTFHMKSLTNDTPQTKVRVDFTHIQTNPKLEPSVFTYVSQPGDVVHEQ